MARTQIFRSATPITDDVLRAKAPSIFATEAHNSRSDRYAYIPTIDVLNGLRNEGFYPVAVGQTLCRDEGKREHTKHLLRFRSASDLQHGLAVGKEIPEIVLVNSHDGASAYQLTAGFFRLVCSNGLVVGDPTIEVKVRHSGNIIDNVIEGSFRVVDGIKEIAPVIDTWKSIRLDQGESEAYAKAAIGLRWDEGEAPVAPTRLLGVRRYEDREPTLWNIFNRAQENLTKGGLRGIGTTGRRTTTREVSSVSENTRLNKALWTLTAELARIKAAA